MWVNKLIPNSLLKRILKLVYFKNLKQAGASYLEITNSILKNRYINNSNYVLSNYGVWLFSNYSDKTFNLAILGYRNKLDIFLGQISEPTVFLDIGANQGVFSSIAAKNDNIIEIHAFEPNLMIVKYLEKNFKVNKIYNSYIHKVAITSRNSKSKFLSLSKHSGAGKISNDNWNMYINGVNHEYLNTVFGNYNFSFFIKIDVEGSELTVVRELFRSEIKSKIKNIFIEVTHSSNLKKSPVIQLLEEEGFVEKYRKSTNANSFDAFFIR